MYESSTVPSGSDLVRIAHVDAAIDADADAAAAADAPAPAAPPC